MTHVLYEYNYIHLVYTITIYFISVIVSITMTSIFTQNEVLCY